MATPGSASGPRLADPFGADGPRSFGTVFTPRMMLASYVPGEGWGAASLVDRAPLQLDPATVVLHYGQAAFEGLTAQQQVDGSWALFRARDYAERLTQSCERMAIPPIPVADCLATWREFVAAEAPALPTNRPTALYLRPLVFGCDDVLGDRPSTRYQMVLLGVVIDLTEPGRRKRLEVLITDQFVRAASGGVGMAKVPGNYGAGMLARRAAAEYGCDQVLWLDAGRRRWVEELGSMNVMFQLGGTLVTPPLTDTILAGVTRSTLLALARDHGLDCEERPIALEEITAAMSWKGLTEAMGCGTAVGVASINAFHLGERTLELPLDTPVADRLRALLSDLQQGRAEDVRGWLTPV